MNLSTNGRLVILSSSTTKFLIKNKHDVNGWSGIARECVARRGSYAGPVQVCGSTASDCNLLPNNHCSCTGLGSWVGPAYTPPPAWLCDKICHNSNTMPILISFVSPF